MLFMKICLIHSSSPAAMSHFLAISAMDPQNCSSDSLSRCFRFNNLGRSNVTFVFLTIAVARFSQNKICKIFTFVNFVRRFFFLRFQELGTRLIVIFYRLPLFSFH